MCEDVFTVRYVVSGLFRLEIKSEMGDAVDEYGVPKCRSVDMRIQILKKCYFFLDFFFLPVLQMEGSCEVTKIGYLKRYTNKKPLEGRLTETHKESLCNNLLINQEVS